MAQGDFTQEEAKQTKAIVKEIFYQLAKTKQTKYLPHLNDALMFLESAERLCPVQSMKKG